MVKTFARLLPVVAMGMGCAHAQMLTPELRNGQADIAAYRQGVASTAEDGSQVGRASQVMVDSLGTLAAVPYLAMANAQKDTTGRAAGLSYVAAKGIVDTSMKAGEYGTIPAGRRRTMLVTAYGADYLMPHAGAGEPLHLVSIERRYPVLTVPALQSWMSRMAGEDVGRPLGAYGTAIDNGWSIPLGADEAQVAQTRSELDEGVEKASQSLAAWNATVPPDSLTFDEKSAIERRYHATFTAAAVDPTMGYTRLATGVTAHAVMSVNREMIVVEIVNASGAPYVFKPQDWAFMGRNGSETLLAPAFRREPLPRTAAGICLAGVEPAYGGYGGHDDMSGAPVEEANAQAQLDEARKKEGDHAISRGVTRVMGINPEMYLAQTVVGTAAAMVQGKRAEAVWGVKSLLVAGLVKNQGEMLEPRTGSSVAADKALEAADHANDFSDHAKDVKDDDEAARKDREDVAEAEEGLEKARATNAKAQRTRDADQASTISGADVQRWRSMLSACGIH